MCKYRTDVWVELQAKLNKWEVFYLNNLKK